MSVSVIDSFYLKLIFKYMHLFSILEVMVKLLHARIFLKLRVKSYNFNNFIYFSDSLDFVRIVYSFYNFFFKKFIKFVYIFFELELFFMSSNVFIFIFFIYSILNRLVFVYLFVFLCTRKSLEQLFYIKICIF